MKTDERLSKTLTGISGEYFVAAELSRLGYIASITLKNTRGIDILCSNSDAKKHVSIQVKTSKTKGNTWMLHKKDEEFFSKSHKYVFVLIHENSPEFFIVPSEVVAKFISKSHAKWIKGKKADGTARKNTNRRKFKDILGEYRSRWDLLGLD